MGSTACGAHAGPMDELSTRADPRHAVAGRVVVGLDGSEGSELALVWAAEQAAVERRPLVLVHAAPPLPFPSGAIGTQAGLDRTAITDAFHAAAAGIFERATRRVRATWPELEVSSLAFFSDPRVALLDLGREAEMLVVGSRGRGPVESLLLGSVSVTVSRRATCPVVVVRSAPRASHDGITVYTDASSASEEAIEFAFRTASARGLALTLMRCVPGLLSRPVDADGAVVEDEETAGQHAVVAETLARMEEKFPDVPARVRVVRTPAATALVEESRTCDLLVLGHHHRTALADFVRASLTPLVVEHALGNVAIVTRTRADDAT